MPDSYGIDLTSVLRRLGPRVWAATRIDAASIVAMTMNRNTGNADVVMTAGGFCNTGRVTRPNATTVRRGSNLLRVFYGLVGIQAFELAS